MTIIQKTRIGVMGIDQIVLSSKYLGNRLIFNHAVEGTRRKVTMAETYI